jgi:alpha-galactosidase
MLFQPIPVPEAALADGLSAFRFADMLILYRRDPVTAVVGLELIPLSKADSLVPARAYLTEHEVEVLPAFFGKIRAGEIDSLVQLKVLGDVYPNGFAGGRTMRGSASVLALKLERQAVEGDAIVTVLRDAARGLLCEHRLSPLAGGKALQSVTRVVNEGTAPFTLEMLSSFSLGGLTPFAADDAPGRLRLHRFRSSWSSEGRADTQTFEQLQLERSWAGHGVGCERFGQVGSQPVRGWFPFAAVEDTGAGVVWAAKLAWPGSWQIELYRRHDRAALSGGQADREFGHWMKTLAPGEWFVTPPAMLTVVAGDLDDACDRLNAAQPLDLPPEESALPVVFNEWCYTWGKPTRDSMVAVADRLSGLGVRYLVIDDGWAERKGEMFQQNGDWRVNEKSFPGGLGETVRALAERGYVTGIWFEFEVLNDGSDAWKNHEAHVLRRDGRPLEVGNRRFWDFRDPWVHEYLHEKVVRLLRENGFGYLKVDYNDTLGIGCDGAESPGSGLHDHLLGVQRFFRRLREELPELVIENCSSGGHRAEPSFLALTSMTSFSDAHEGAEIPVIAANLLRLLPARQNQIWAVLRPEDNEARTVYSLTASLIGRVCLSGPVDKLSDAQLELIKCALALYHRMSPLLIDGVNRRFGPVQTSQRHPQGWQAVRRVSADGARALVLAHSFATAGAVEALVPLPDGRWEILDFLAAAGDQADIVDGSLRLRLSGAFRGVAAELRRI